MTPCSICSKTQTDPVRGIVCNINWCAMCDAPICDEHADFDADCEGDPPAYVGVATCKNGCAHPYVEL